MIQKFAQEFSINLPFGNNQESTSKSQVMNSSRRVGQRQTYHPTAHEQLDFQGNSKQEQKFNIHEKISKALTRMDLLLKENFELKREIVFERKKFIDLNSAYTDLRKNLEEENIFPNSINDEYQIDKDALSI